ncbi:Remorin, C-terminal [Parasponia andersonii]|uniref:Remorin, C-terminal n=1 Tax=Parasponia andersonii TaxID=3476 RepID=A0A2P5DHD5_PARAD|nr:Remorin, C-terminal [Parasponia andersonii]
MEYERIHKVQTGMISPSKLRMKLMGPHHLRKKDGSNSNSSRTSPSKLDDTDFVKNSLLATTNGDEEVTSPSLDVPPMKSTDASMPDARQSDPTSDQLKESLPKQNGETARVRLQQCSKGDSSNSSTVHPVKILEDDNLDYDSNASSSSFEFHKGERSGHNPISRCISRPMPSKWNDAEKWIMNRQNCQANYHKRNALQNQTNRIPPTNMMRVAPESAHCDNRLLFSRMADTKRDDFCQTASQIAFDKFSFVSSGTQLVSGQPYAGNAMIDQSTQSRDLKELGELTYPKSSADETTGIPAIRSVSMRDMGTEMTPGTSLEPSRTATPVGATTPIRSPTSSMPSTPRGVAPASTPAELALDGESQHTENNKKELSEEELKLKTRREIVALGVQLGKMNIAAWASKEEQEKKRSAEKNNAEELDRIEYEKRAAAWEEAEKSKHYARFKREEIKIQAWESQQKAILEAEMRRIEAKVEQMRAQAQAKMVKKIALTRQRSEEKQAAAEARKNRDAEKTAAQAEYIRQTGKMPSASQYICCGWLMP